MPWEHIGECGDADIGDGRARMVMEVELGCQYIRLVCGNPPRGCKIGVMWNEHELGDYSTVGLFWDPSLIADAPWGYISRAEKAISRFAAAVDWQPIDEDDEDEDEDYDDSEEEDTGVEREDTAEPPLYT